MTYMLSLEYVLIKNLPQYYYNGDIKGIFGSSAPINRGNVTFLLTGTINCHASPIRTYIFRWFRLVTMLGYSKYKKSLGNTTFQTPKICTTDQCRLVGTSCPGAKYYFVALGLRLWRSEEHVDAFAYHLELAQVLTIGKLMVGKMSSPKIMYFINHFVTREERTRFIDMKISKN